MTLLFVVVIIAVVAGVAVLVVRDQPVVEDDPVLPQPLVWPPAGPVGAEDVDAARFAVALRGYRMDEVDRVLADVATALAERDERIAVLEAGRGEAGTGAGDADQELAQAGAPAPVAQDPAAGSATTAPEEPE